MQRLEFGKAAELLIAKILRQKGYEVFEDLKFLRKKQTRGQIDLLAVSENHFWVVEVKRRKTIPQGALLFSFQQKQRLYRLGFEISSQARFRNKIFKGVLLALVHTEENAERVHFLENPW